MTADIFADGHDILYAVLRHSPASRTDWEEVPMEALPNDLWQGEFSVQAQGRHLYTLQAWTDQFHSWSRDMVKKFEAAQDLSVDILAGVQLIEATAAARQPEETNPRSPRQPQRYAGWPRLICRRAVERSSSPELQALMIRNADRRRATTYSRELAVIVDREKARFSAWYEMFPRSCSTAARAARNSARIAPRGWTTSPAWASTLSTFRRFIPSAA